MKLLFIVPTPGYGLKEERKKANKAYRRFYLRFGYLKRKIRAINSKEDIIRYFQGIEFLLKMKLLKSPGL